MGPSALRGTRDRGQPFSRAALCVLTEQFNYLVPVSPRAHTSSSEDGVGQGLCQGPVPCRKGGSDVSS